MSVMWRVSALVLVFGLGCRHTTTSTSSDAGSPDAATTGGHELCVDGRSVDGAYPGTTPSLDILGTIPDLSFAGEDEHAAPTTIALHDYFEPCAQQSRLLIIRASAAWCGTCRWSAAHTKEFLSADFGSRLVWLDLLIANEDNVPASARDLSGWQAQIDQPGLLALDPGNSLAPLNDIHAPLPFFVLIDTRTMTIRFAGGNPDPDWLADRIRQELADLDKVPEPATHDRPMVDGYFSRAQWSLMQDITLPNAPPPDPTNAHADDPAAADLGRRLFSDTSLSPSNTVSCATCHDSTKHFADGRPQSLGVTTGDRNAPSVLFAAHSRWQFWDGRADSLWAQALGPFENEKEFQSSRLFVVHAISDRYRADYEQIFGAMPDVGMLPPSGKPGDAAWDNLSDGGKDTATRIFVNVGKSLAAYERTLRAAPNRLDAYLAGDKQALTETEKHGMQLFFTAGCMQCHYGPRLTDDAFHDVRFPTGRQDSHADRGRIDGVTSLLASTFLATSAFSDAPSAAHGLDGLAPLPSMLGALKTPALRGVANTAPYGHGGSLATLKDVVQVYSTAGLPLTDTRTIGAEEASVSRFSTPHIDDLVAFLQALEAEPAP